MRPRLTAGDEAGPQPPAERGGRLDVVAFGHDGDPDGDTWRIRVELSADDEGLRRFLDVMRGIFPGIDAYARDIRHDPREPPRVRRALPPGPLDGELEDP